MQFETDGGALGSVVVSQVSPGRKNRLWIESTRPTRRSPSTRRTPSCCGAAGATASRSLPRDADVARRRPPRASRTLPAGHPQGYADCFDAFVADVYAAIRSGDAARGHAALRRRPSRRRRSPRPCSPRRRRRRLDRRRGARARGGGHVKLGFLTACMPERSLEDDRRVGRRARLRGARARRLADARATGPSPPPTSPPTRFDERRGRARHARALDEQRPGALRARLLRQQPRIRTPPSARRSTRTCARASTLRPRSAACPSGRSSAATPAAASPRTCARPSASSRRSSATRASAA